MTQDALDNALEKLSDFESASPYDTSEIEVCMDALATALFELVRAPDNDEEPDSLAEAVGMLQIPKHVKSDLVEICSAIAEVIERSDYDSDADDQEDRLSDLKSDFYGLLEPQLSKLKT